MCDKIIKIRPYTMEGLFYGSMVCGEKIIVKVGRCLHA